MANPMISANEGVGKNSVTGRVAGSQLTGSASKLASLRRAILITVVIALAGTSALLWTNRVPDRRAAPQSQASVATADAGGRSIAAALAGEFSVLDSSPAAFQYELTPWSSNDR